MSKDTITVNMNVYDIPIVVEQLNKLEQENKILREKVGELTQSLNEQMKLTNDENLDCGKYAIKNNQLKEVIEEVKTEISSLMSKYFYEKDFCIEDIHLDNLLQILDKAKENK